MAFTTEDPRNIHQLHVVQPPVAFDPEAIAMLRNLLVAAERGEVLSFAVAVQLTAEQTGTSYAIGNGGDVAHLVTAIERIKLRLLGVHP